MNALNLLKQKPNRSQKQKKFFYLIRSQNDQHTYPSTHREYMHYYIIFIIHSIITTY